MVETSTENSRSLSKKTVFWNWVFYAASCIECLSRARVCILDLGYHCLDMPCLRGECEENPQNDNMTCDCGKKYYGPHCEFGIHVP